MKLTTIILLLFCIGFGNISIAQDLPVGFAPGEKEQIPNYKASRIASTNGITTPPPGPLRTAAEWEEIEYLFIAWKGYTSILTEIVRNARLECKVVIVCTDSSAVKTTLTNASVSLSNVQYLIQSANSVWIRDYGGNSVYMNDVDSLIFVDWIYNRPRPLDDVVPDGLTAMLGVQNYSTTTPPYDLVNTGGNFMCDGFGTAFASNLILEDNDADLDFNFTVRDAVGVDSVMQRFMGINRYIKMDVLPYDGIHHIDMHMKLLDEQTLLVGEYPAGISDGPQIEANLQYVLSNFNSVFGTPYKAIRIVQPPDAGGAYPSNFGDYRTYSNAVFVNKTVLLPLYEPEYDTTALRIWRESLPGYNVVGINCNSIISASGAIHCITHAMGVRDPLLISHQPLEDTYDDANPYFVNSTIQHRSGIDNATLYYTTDTALGFTSLPMMEVFGQWQANIPAQSIGSTIYYYIHAEAVSGKQQVRPIVAPDGWWKFEVLSPAAIGVNSNSFSGITALYPNPASAITCIEMEFSNASQGRVVLMDVFGREILKIFEGNIPAGNSKYFFDASQLASGTYIVKMDYANGSDFRKVIVK